MSQQKTTQGFDDFDMGLEDIPTLKPIKKDTIDRDAMKQVQKEHGFDRTVNSQPENPVGQGAQKEPIKAVQFRMPQSEAAEFYQMALDEFGNAHGGKIALFRKMIAVYKAQRVS